MPYTVFDEQYRQALDASLACNDRLIFIGSTGLQLLLVEELPPTEVSRIISPADALEIYECENVLPAQLCGIPVRKTITSSLSQLLEREKRRCSVLGKSYPVAAPEHLVGMKLSPEILSPKEEWECYTLLATLANNGKEVNYEMIRSFVKGCPDPRRELLLKEWAYTLRA